VIGNMEGEHIAKLDGMLDKLTVNKFFEYYSELREYYEFLAKKYHFD
jgi:hypothetical protein